MTGEENDSNCNYGIPLVTQRMLVGVTDVADYNCFFKLFLWIVLLIMITKF